MIQELQINHQHFILHAEGAMFWKEQKMLLISDVHLGKISHFRKYGSAVPQKAIAKNFQRLSRVTEYFNPEKICFLGDLFHSALNAEWEIFMKWLEKTSVESFLIAGNHDIISPLKFEEAGVKVYPELILQNFLLTHHPENREGVFNICGHLHPGYKLQGTGRQQLALPCFYMAKDQVIMPAFGEFTGNYWISPVEGEQVFVITKKEVICVY